MNIIQDDIKYPYTLDEIRQDARVHINSIHTARKYLHEVIPQPYERMGHGKGARYSENTKNSFIVLRLLLNKKLFTWKQMTAVMTKLGQQQINMIASGEESLKIHVAASIDGDYCDMKGSIPNLSRDDEAYLVTGNEVSSIKVNGEIPEPHSDLQQSEVWKVATTEKKLQLRYKGELSKEQIEELQVAVRMLRAIINK